MPALSETHWVTLAQALHWIANRVQPVDAGPIRHEGQPERLPISPDADGPKQELYELLLNGRVELHGTRQLNFGSRLNESTGEYADQYDLAPIKQIPRRAIANVSIKDIDWKCGSLCTRDVFTTHEEPDTRLRWNNLRVRWAELYRVTTGETLPDPEVVFSDSSAAAGGDLKVGGVAEAEEVKKFKRKRGRHRRSDWPVLAALTAIMGARDSLFWNLSAEDMISSLKPILMEGGHQPPGESVAPGKSSYAIHAVKVVHEAMRLIGRRWPPETLPAVSALVAIVREHDAASGGDRCESEMHNQIELLIKIFSGNDEPGLGTPTGSSLYRAAVVAAKNASEAHGRLCQKSLLSPN